MLLHQKSLVNQCSLSPKNLLKNTRKMKAKRKKMVKKNTKNKNMKNRKKRKKKKDILIFAETLLHDTQTQLLPKHRVRLFVVRVTAP